MAPRRLGQGTWLAMAERNVSVPALSLATPATPFEVQGESVNGVFCLAARDDAHLGLLERLAALLEEGGIETLRHGDAETVLARLAGEGAAAHTQRVRVLNAHGLHARPAKQLVQVAREQAVPIRVRLAEGGAEPVSATSLTKVIGLGARRGQWLVFSAEGEGAEQALSTIGEAVVDGLGEAVEPSTTATNPCRRLRRPTRKARLSPCRKTPLIRRWPPRRAWPLRLCS